MNSNKTLFAKIAHGEDIGPDLEKTLEILRGLLNRLQVASEKNPCAVTNDDSGIEYLMSRYGDDRTFAENFLRLHLGPGTPSLTEAVSTAEANLREHLKHYPRDQSLEDTSDDTSYQV